MTRLFEDSELFVELTEEQAETVAGGVRGVDLAALVRDAFYANPNWVPGGGSNPQAVSTAQPPQDYRSFQGLTISSLPVTDLEP